MNEYLRRADGLAIVSFLLETKRLPLRYAFWPFGGPSVYTDDFFFFQASKGVSGLPYR